MEARAQLPPLQRSEKTGNLGSQLQARRFAERYDEQHGPQLPTFCHHVFDCPRAIEPELFHTTESITRHDMHT